MSDWISVNDRLPKQDQVVVIYDGSINIARFERGISVKDREKMKRGEIEDPTHTVWSVSDGCRIVKRSDCIRMEDEWGNNTKPYCWISTCSPMQWVGQKISYWMPLPEPPKED